MPITDLPGLPDWVAAILLVIFDVALVIWPDIWLTAGLLSGYLPTAAACRMTDTWTRPRPPPPAAVVRPGVEVPLAVPLPPLLRWMTRSTIAATPITAAARYRPIRTPPGRCGDRTAERGPERAREPRPGAARPSSPNPAAAGASKPG